MRIPPEYDVDHWTLCTKQGHTKGGKWTHGKECSDHPATKGGPVMTVVSLDWDTGTVTVKCAPVKS